MLRARVSPAAVQLLRSANHDALVITLRQSGPAPGVAQASSLFAAQQAPSRAQPGVRVSAAGHSSAPPGAHSEGPRRRVRAAPRGVTARRHRAPRKLRPVAPRELINVSRHLSDIELGTSHSANHRKAGKKLGPGTGFGPPGGTGSNRSSSVIPDASTLVCDARPPRRLRRDLHTPAVTRGERGSTDTMLLGRAVKCALVLVMFAAVATGKASGRAARGGGAILLPHLYVVSRVMTAVAAGPPSLMRCCTAVGAGRPDPPCCRTSRTLMLLGRGGYVGG